MCGIVGYVGFRNAKEVLLKALKRLEYRGYDSAGVAILNSTIKIEKRKGFVDSLDIKFGGNIGIAHTRWATHGKPSDENAHPFTDCKREFAIVHNGIIENFMELKKMLSSRGHIFTSDTDSEVIVHLLEEFYNGDFLDTFIKVVNILHGSFAIVAIHQGDNVILGAKKESPLVIGCGDHENFVASDIPAFLEYTNRVITLNDGEICEVSSDSVKVYDFKGEAKYKQVQYINWTVEYAEKGGFEHFMLKEIFEQPRALEETLYSLTSREFYLTPVPRKISIVACGTSYHAGLVGKYLFEKYLKIPVEVHYASEYRYRPDVRENPLVILITQSGETADTLAAARIARRRGYRTLAITNVLGSSITNYVDDTVYTSAGPEIGVAATKTFTAQLIAMHYLAIESARAWNFMSHIDYESRMDLLRRIPYLVEKVMDIEERIIKEASYIKNKNDIFYIARGINYPVAMEGALKMKEISYIHAEAYPAGELKHGPMALIDEDVHVVAIISKNKTYSKMLGNLKEVSARGAYVIAVSPEEEVEKYSDSLIPIPEDDDESVIYTASVVLQLLAYHTAKMLGREIDKPKNLAKSVTVE